MHIRFTLIWTALWATVAFGGFSQAPSTVVQGGKATITFSLDAATDVEVSVLDASGKIIRHLAAGLLGGASAPPAPLTSGLSQSLEWDGKDDGGNWATGGSFTARVRLGVRPVFERSISTQVFPGTGWDYSTSTNVRWTADYLDPDHIVLKRIWGCYPGTCQHRPGGLDIAVSDASDEVFIKQYRYGYADYARIDGRTGQTKAIVTPRFPAGTERQYWGEPSISWDGKSLYHGTGFDFMFRFNLDGTLSSWPGSGKTSVTGLPQGKQHVRGQAEGSDGSLYVLHHLLHFIAESSAVSRVSPDGNIAQRELIRMYTEAGGGVKVDPQGNIFVGAMVKPKGQHWPPALTSLMPPKTAKAASTLSSQPWSTRAPHFWAFALYGSVLKFGPTGGSVMPDVAGDLWIRPNANLYTATTAKATGLKGMYYGMSHIGWSKNMAYGGIMCVCNVTRFDVDRYGRVFLPDGFRLSVVGLDNNMNELFRQHNRDVTQNIGYIHQLEVTDRAIYAADWYNNQIAVFSLKAQDSASASVPLSVSKRGLAAPGRAVLDHFPNPAVSSATLAWNLRGRIHAPVQLGLFDHAGKLVRTFDVREPQGRVVWDGRDDGGRRVASGVYFYRFLGRNVQDQGKLIYAE